MAKLRGPTVTAPKVNISPSTGWQLQTKVTSATVPHLNHPTSAPKVGQLSQPDSYGRAMRSATKATKVYGVPGK